MGGVIEMIRIGMGGTSEYKIPRGGVPLHWGKAQWSTGMDVVAEKDGFLRVPSGTGRILSLRVDCPVRMLTGDPGTLLVLALHVNGRCAACDGGHVRLGEMLFLHADACLPIPGAACEVRAYLHPAGGVTPIRARVSGASILMRREEAS